jgi:hypothetical protein
MKCQPLSRRQAGAKIKITEEMIEAGRIKYREELGDDYAMIPCEGETIAAVFRAMFAVSPFVAGRKGRRDRG